MTVWPSEAKQQRMCKRQNIITCVAVGAPGCELYMPCRYTDDQLRERQLPAAEHRENHARINGENPLHCSGCFNARPRPERESLVTEHLLGLYGEKEPHVIVGLRGDISRNVATFADDLLSESRDWSSYEWQGWMDANLPPLPAE